MWFFLLVFYLTSEICHPRSIYALTDTADVNISASIGENEVTIFGYTSPNSLVELDGGQSQSPLSQKKIFIKIVQAADVRIYAKTYSNDIGYFEFNKLVLPKNPSELCLISADSSGRQTTPICTPPPPATNYHTDIGPIILPPTISLEQEKINPNSTVISSGQSIPNAPLIVFFYKVNDGAKSFPKGVLAYSLPPIKTTTDENGNYSLNLPTAYSSNYRLYTSVKYDGSNSPKSNTLLYFMPSLFWLFLQQHTYLMVLLPIFIFTLILFSLLLFFNSKIYHRISQLRFLPALRTSYPAIRTQHFPHIYPDVLPRTLKIAK